MPYPCATLAIGYRGYVPEFYHLQDPTDLVGDKMKKFVLNNRTYLISQNPAVKFAYSINDDYILDTYGIREWVNNMETTQLTEQHLDDYIIVAL
jgi:hypothetical protein